MLLLAGLARSVSADHLDDVVGAEMAKRGIPGMAVAIIENSSIVREQGYGYSDAERKTPVTAETLFQAASVSKAVTALGALRLVEQGKVSLDEDITRSCEAGRFWRASSRENTL